MTEDVVTFCIENNIVLYRFLAHATNILQPLDIALFSQMKTRWSAVAYRYVNKEQVTINRPRFLKLIRPIWYEFTVKEVGENGFRYSGIFPHNVENIDWSRLVHVRMQNFAGYKEMQTQTSRQGHPTGVDHVLFPSVTPINGSEPSSSQLSVSSNKSRIEICVTTPEDKIGTRSEITIDGTTVRLYKDLTPLPNHHNNKRPMFQVSQQGIASTPVANSSNAASNAVPVSVIFFHYK